MELLKKTFAFGLVTLFLSFVFMAAASAISNTEFFKMKAEMGDAEAQTIIGSSYTEGSNGLSQDYDKAIYWYKKAADQGYAAGQYFLGIAYNEGQGVQQDYVQANYWFKKAADQNDSTAQFSLAVSYILGRGVQENTTIGKQWLSKSCINGDQDACEGYRILTKAISNDSSAF